jgi:hypothetical protein
MHGRHSANHAGSAATTKPIDFSKIKYFNI